MSRDGRRGKVVWAQPFDASTLIDIWLDGCSSGIASAVLYLMPMLTDQQADEFTDGLCHQMMDDPAVMETVRRQVLERVQGVPGHPYTMSLHTGEG